VNHLQACTAVAAIALFALAGCDAVGPSRPTQVYTPDLIGPIDEVRDVPGDRLSNELIIGDQMIRYTKDWPRDLGFTPSEGALLIYGNEDGDEWFLTLGRAGAGALDGCYTLPADGVYDDGTHLIFTVSEDEAIRLPKGADLALPEPDPETGRYPSSHSGYYCIEEDGTVSATNLP
jgi:hypothetical protein